MNKPDKTNKTSANPTELIKEFLRSIKEQFFSAKKLEGGTQYRVFLVNRRYLFKTGNPNKIKSEFIFNNYYKGEHFVQKLVFCDKNYNYIVYNYIPGGILSECPNPKNVLKKTFKFINNYKNYNESGYGDLIKPSTSYEQYLLKLTNDCKSQLKGVFLKEHFVLIENSIKTLANFTYEKKLLHGDLRKENFIFDNNNLTGIIDPYPMSGDPLYDQIFFLFSSVQMSKIIPLNKIYKKLKQPKEKVKTYMLIVLCVKLKRMLKYKNDNNNINYFTNLFYEVIKL